MKRDLRPPREVVHRLAIDKIERRANGGLAAVLSSELPVERERGTETLVHSPEAVDLTRAAKGLPLLFEHDVMRHIGRVEKIRLDGRKLVGEIRLSKKAEDQGVVADILDGIRPDISIGYTIEAATPEPGGNGYRCTRWTLLEVSSVALPADFSAGVGRSAATATEGNEDMFRRTIESAGPGPSGAAAPANPGDTHAAGVAAERNRTATIEAMGERLNVPDLARRAISEGLSVEQFSEAFERSHSSARAIPFAESVTDDRFAAIAGRFSLSRAVADVLNNGRLTGREAEVSAELIRRGGGLQPKGFMAPIQVLQQRTHVVGTAASAGNLVGTDYRDDLFIEPLRNASVTLMMGATSVTDLVGNVDIPRQVTKVAGTWVAEDQPADETDVTFDKVSLSPKTITGRMSWSRQMGLQGLPSMEELLRRDLVEQLGLGLDFAALHGLGSSNQPRGIFNIGGVGSVPIGANGGAPTYGHMLELESALATQNAELGSLGYVTNPKVRKALKQTQRFSGTDSPVWTPGQGMKSGQLGQVNGYRAFASNQVRSDFTKGSGTNLSGVAYGNWADLIIGFWGGLDILVDPYFYSDRGRIRISAFLSADLGVRHAASFAIISDAVAA